jgi:hypothetical protein
MIYLSLGLNYISEETQKELIEMCNEEGRIINGLISSLQKLKPNS